MVRISGDRPIEQIVQDTAHVAPNNKYVDKTEFPTKVEVKVESVKDVIKKVTDGFSKFKEDGDALKSLAVHGSHLSAAELVSLKIELEREQKESPHIFSTFKKNKAKLLSELNKAYEPGFDFKCFKHVGTLEVKKEYAGFVRTLIASGADALGMIMDNLILYHDILEMALPKMIQEDKNRLLFIAVNAQKFDTVSTLITSGASPTEVDLSRLYLAGDKAVPLALMLIKAGADASKISDENLLRYPEILAAALPKMTQEKKNQLLQIAVTGSNVDAAKILTENGANTAISDENLLRYPEILAAALPNMKPEKKNQLLQAAVSSSNRDIAKILIENGASAANIDVSKIKLGVANGLMLLSMLLEAGADSSKIPDNTFLEYPEILNTTLPKMTLDNKNELLKNVFNLKHKNGFEAAALRLIKAGADVSNVPNNMLVRYPEIFSAALLGMTQEKKNQLLHYAHQNEYAGVFEKITIDLIKAGASALGIPDEILLANPALLEAGLSQFEASKIEDLLLKASPSDITRAILLDAKTHKPEHKTEALPPSEKSEVELSLLNSKSLFDVQKPDSKQTDFKPEFIEQLENKPLKELLNDYENFKIGRGLPDSLLPKDLGSTLSVIRAVISQKITQLSKTEKDSLSSEIARFKTTASAAQFSGTLDSAHRLGIRGGNVRVSILEDIAEDVRSIGKNAVVTGTAFGLDSSHGYHVTGISQQLAPDASINVQSNPSVIDDSAKIVNCSFGSAQQNRTPPLLKTAMESGKLIVQSAGNDGKPLDFDPNASTRTNDQNFLTNLPDDQKSRMILTGNLQAGNVPAPRSNMPGANEKLQDHFLWTLGSDVLSLTGPDTVGPKTGTSMSAPVVTGAAALVQSFWPEASPEQVKECLLESADRDFWIHKPNISIHVVSPDKPSELKVNPERAEATWPFDKKVFGKGLLNVRRALEYANLKKGHPELKPGEICQILDYKEEQAAIKIQKLFREGRPKTEFKREISTSSFTSNNSRMGASSNSSVDNID